MPAPAAAAGLLLWSLLAGPLGAAPAEGKLEAGTVHLGGRRDEDRWGYLGKFGYAIGERATYDVRFRLRPGGAARAAALLDAAAAPEVDLEVFLDVDWDRALTLPACQRAADGPAKRTFRKVDLGREPGEWGPWVSGFVSQSIRPHIWYFAASSCASGGLGGADVDFEVRMRQPDGSELGVELRWMPSVSAVALACLTAFLGCFVRRCRLAAMSTGPLHPVLCALAAAVALQWAALLLEVLHLWAYSSNGVGSPAADALAGALDMLSQVVTVTLLIAIARGYSLASAAEACELSSMRRVALAVAFLHVVLVLLDKLDGEASHEHHENGGALGLILLAARLLLFAAFARESGELQARAGLRLQSFLRRFRAAGSAYLLAYPALLLAVQAFAPYLRHPLLMVGLLGAQASAASWLAGLFLSKGAYYEVSSMSSSLLPGCGGAHGLSLGAPAACAASSLRRRGGC
ncbi:unnamed protein product [Prorocentrum cordatum]|uniref:GPR180/TMEM145 transmembrane domain-containing protein n=1 Tax=Prorocentrum cordatum TaxID=2364126 RepID=A0ABN9S463_9DINO|nr:unnamed protein product [Polarella glacialis]